MSVVLGDAIQILQKERAEKLREVEAIDRALKELEGVKGSSRGPQADYRGLGIVEACWRYMAEVNRECTTGELAKVLKERGLESNAKNFTATVYATLANELKRPDSKVLRQNQKWGLRQAAAGQVDSSV